MTFHFLPSESKIPDVMEALFDLGKTPCDTGYDFQSDLVIDLSHSGWIPVVTRALWQFAKRLPFPPCLRLNLGLEKAGLFHERLKVVGVDGLNANHNDDFRVAPLLAGGDALT